MLANRSIPQCTVIPVLAYPNVGEAIEWLCGAFGFSLRLRIADHRAQLNVGDGAVVVAEGGLGSSLESAHSVMVRVDNVDVHHERAILHGAKILGAPTSYPYGERQYSAEDIGGHRWTFSQSVADVAPEEWGGKSEQL